MYKWMASDQDFREPAYYSWYNQFSGFPNTDREPDPNGIFPGPEIFPGPNGFFPGTPCLPQYPCNPCGIEFVQTWTVKPLVANQLNQASTADPRLVDAWGIVITHSQLWVAANTTDVLTNYDLFGNSVASAVSVRNPAFNSTFPSGVVVNYTNGFAITKGNVTKPSFLIIVTEHGHLHGYNPQVDPLNTVVVSNRSPQGAVYWGVTILCDRVYAADFYNGRIDVFDQYFNMLSGFPFVDADTINPIPIGFGPSNITAIGDFLYVTYALRNPAIPMNDLPGPGNGFVSIFNPNGYFLRRLVTRGKLNSPWGIIPAPKDNTYCGERFWIGNNGNGRIHIYDCEGRYHGNVRSPGGHALQIDGLRGLVANPKCCDEVYFASGPDNERNGLVGVILKNTIVPAGTLRNPGCSDGFNSDNE